MIAARQSRLVEQEAIVEQGLAAFVAAGMALAAIRDERLYRPEHATFEAYCQARWGLTDRRARQLIDAASVAADLAKTGTNGSAPNNERQVRPLLSVPAEMRAQVWGLACEAAGGVPSGADVEDAIEELLGCLSAEGQAAIIEGHEQQHLARRPPPPGPDYWIRLEKAVVRLRTILEALQLAEGPQVLRLLEGCLQRRTAA